MRIVLIARTIYPHLTPRAFRTTELAKQLAKIGHDVTIYASLGNYDYTTFEKKTNVKVRPIKMHFSTLNSDGKIRYNIFDKLAFHLFHRSLEYPDIEFVWKVSSLINKLDTIDLLITIAYPHPIHWGAALAKKQHPETFPKKWISDCGDPFMGNGVGKRPPFYFEKVERFWSEQTDFITIPVEEGRKSYFDCAQDKIHIIPQGFDFSTVKLNEAFRFNEVPHFAYAGSIYPGLRDPSRFLKYLCTLDRSFVFTVYTNNKAFYAPYKDKLGDKLFINDYKPREELIYELSSQDFLINIQNPNTVQSPSKLIDYFLSTRPILDITSQFNECENFEAFLEYDYTHRHPNVNINQYNIENIAKQFLSL